MAAGDAVTANNATAASGTFTVQPAAGVEWVIHNIFVTGAANLKMTDGTTVVTLKAMVAGEWQTNIAVHDTNGRGDVRRQFIPVAWILSNYRQTCQHRNESSRPPHKINSLGGSLRRIPPVL